MKRSFYILLSIIFMIGFGSSCRQQNQTNVEEQTLMPVRGDVTLSNDKVKRAGIYFGKIEPALLSYDVSARGQVVVPPQNKAAVSVMIGGVIREIFVDLGEKVYKGQVLATYSTPDFIRMQQRYLSARNRWMLIEKEYERQKKLIGQNIKSEKEFQETESDYNEALSDLRAAEAELDMLGINRKHLEENGIETEIKIKSPITGVINNVYGSIGLYVDIQQPLFEVVNLDDLRLRVKVFEKDIPFIKPGQRITFRLSDKEAELNEAYIENIGSSVDPEGRVITVLATIKTQGLDLIPGMFVAAKIHTSEAMRDALPETAIIIDRDEENYGFYTLDDFDAPNLSFYKFKVTTGFVEDGFVHVTPSEPLPENAHIALDGVYYLKSELLKVMGE